MRNESKSVLVLDGHPSTSSLTAALAAATADEARAAGHDVRLIHLGDLAFDPDLGEGYQGATTPEPDLEDFIAALEACEVFILIHPMWWGSAPAKLKGLFDRALLPGRAFAYEKGKAFPKRLLTGREARVGILSDTPAWYLRWWLGNPWPKALRRQILEFTGMKVTRTEILSPVRDAPPKRIDGFFDRARALAR
ncbi:NAD(P)H-dependent oxidoreductase [Rhodovulum sp. YNF3179]|uniref:NAD(P)H-dependent oxidoreductase n=1 Tax=Rhodovulum sp. YNF3179 TaxID=3425127 RepID=UPI003D334D33